MQEDPPSPPLRNTTNSIGLYDLLNDEQDPPPDPDSDEDDLPPDSDSDEEDGLDPPGTGSEEEEGSPADPDPDPNPDDPHITLEKMLLDQKFVDMAAASTLRSQFTPAELVRLLDPQQGQSLPSDDKGVRISIEFYIASLDHAQSQRGYATHRSILQRNSPELNILSYAQVKKLVSDLSGIVTWKHDMCVRSCVGFTGPYADLEECPHPDCGEPRYDQAALKKSNGKNKVPRKVFATFPIGPQLQARYQNPRMAQDMSYRRNKTHEEFNRNRGANDYVYDDILCGEDYLKAVESGVIDDNSTVVMLSIDGAQLYRNKKSDCWIYIWLLLDLAPDKRYKIRNILPGGIIPGPGHPKNLDSFLFPGLAHLSALQKEGLRIYDSYRQGVFTSIVFFLLALADAIAMAELSGSVGHHGRRGCRLLCEFAGRNKPGGAHYYPALLRPDYEDPNPTSDHPDINIKNLPHVNPQKYRDNLRAVVSSGSNAQYERRRLETGIRKPSIFDCLPRALRPPSCFPGDAMHQPILNLTALMFDLWCSREGARNGDRDSDWEWAVLKGGAWKTHGEAVANAAKYFPRSFDRTPRNPAEKLSSGYKAWEFLLYFYGLGPGLFYGLLDKKYYSHYCKLIVAIRIFYQRRISRQQLQLGHRLLLEWVLEFEDIYYQRKVERLHFVRQCVHSLTHLGPETHRLGPPSLSAQWTMERVIGIFGSLIKQPSNPFANLTEQAKKVAEINALVAIWPELELEQKDPHGSIDIGGNFLLLGPKDEKPYKFSNNEHTAVVNFYSGLADPEHIPPKAIYRWGRLRIANEQIARSYWKEVLRTSDSKRTDRNLKVREVLSFKVTS